MPEPSPPSAATLVVTAAPEPEGAPLICGLQLQTKDHARGFRPKGTKDWLMVATLGGLGYCRAGGEICTLRHGDLLLFAPDTPQDYGYLDEGSRWVNVWAHFRPRPHWVPWLVWPVVARGTMILPLAERLPVVEAELRRMVEVSTQPTRLRQDMALNALERVLILCDEANPLHRAADLDPRIRKVLEIVGERLAAPLDVDGLSRAAGLSRSRFSVLFAAQTNMSPQAYIEFARLTRAAQMLAMSSWPVGYIAEQVGFSNPYYFSTRFRKRYGVPPSAYRDCQEQARTSLTAQ